jgi:precorrin-6B methylase 2
VLNDFNISSQDSIIDIGCGKGSAMRTMLEFPFARVDGIELSEQIAAITERNFKRLNVDRSRVFICDASLFKNYDAYNIVYFYNPFSSRVMSVVIDALIQSIHRSERELVIIYKHATCHNEVVSQGVFAKIAVYPDELSTGISIYSNRGGGSSRLSAYKGTHRIAQTLGSR